MSCRQQNGCAPAATAPSRRKCISTDPFRSSSNGEDTSSPRALAEVVEAPRSSDPGEAIMRRCFPPGFGNVFHDQTFFIVWPSFCVCRTRVGPSIRTKAVPERHTYRQIRFYIFPFMGGLKVIASNLLETLSHKLSSRLYNTWLNEIYLPA